MSVGTGSVGAQGDEIEDGDNDDNHRRERLELVACTQVIAHCTEHHADDPQSRSRAESFEAADRSSDEHAARGENFGDADRDADVLVAEPYRLYDRLFVADVLFDFMPTVVAHVNGCLEEFGMTNTDYWALRSIDGPIPMKELAHCMDFDPSYVTIVADRLETLGLVERQPHPTDRRVKNLVLTARGRRLKKSIPRALWSGPNTFSTLTDDERAQLTDLLTRLAASNHQPTAATIVPRS